MGSYMTGSMLAGLISPNPKQHELHLSQGTMVFGLGFGLLSIAFGLASKSNVNYLLFCCLANGLQNSFTSTITANVCRTCHFTGITSDMGSFIGQVLRGNKQNLSRLKSITRLGLSFWLGGFVSYRLCPISVVRKYDGNDDSKSSITCIP